MSQESLRDLLARVHERLGANSSVDGESRELLGALVRDIEHALGGGARAAPTGSAPRLKALVVRFQAGHPQLAEVLQELIDALGKAGI